TVAYNRPVCLLFGNEVEGLSEELCTMADACVLIPMYGMKQSLNVSVAFGIALYHAVNEYRDTAGNNHVSGSIGN
ncbi:MAG: TrmH family RNA methyltransferase, partial [Spirochaetota bacterium]